MNWRPKLIVLVLLGVFSLQGLCVPDGFVPLFNGKDLTGWWGLKTEDPADWMNRPADELSARKAASQEDIQAHWRVEDGVLINDGHGLFLTTDKNYGDFELMLQYKTVARADSGIYLRGIPQVQIWDCTEEKKFKIGADKGSGGLWNQSKGAPGKDPLVLADKPFGEWNSFRILMVGEHVTVYLNGKLVVDLIAGGANAVQHEVHAGHRRGGQVLLLTKELAEEGAGIAASVLHVLDSGRPPWDGYAVICVR